MIFFCQYNKFIFFSIYLNDISRKEEKIKNVSGIDKSGKAIPIKWTRHNVCTTTPSAV